MSDYLQPGVKALTEALVGHGVLGVSRLGGFPFTPFLELAGSRVRGFYRESMDWQERINHERSELDFTLAPGEAPPSIGDTVALAIGGPQRLEFAGRVSSVEVINEGGIDGLSMHEISCEDNQGEMRGILITGTWENMTAGAIAKDALETFAPQYDTGGINTTGGDPLERFDALDVPLPDFLTALASAACSCTPSTPWYWRLNPDDSVRFTNADDPAIVSALPVEESEDGHLKGGFWNPEADLGRRDQLRTQVIVDCATSELSAAVPIGASALPVTATGPFTRLLERIVPGERQGENLVIDSEALDAASWSGSGAVTTDVEADPVEGAATADEVAFTGTGTGDQTLETTLQGHDAGAVSAASEDVVRVKLWIRRVSGATQTRLVLRDPGGSLELTEVVDVPDTWTRIERFFSLDAAASDLQLRILQQADHGDGTFRIARVMAERTLSTDGPASEHLSTSGAAVRRRYARLGTTVVEYTGVSAGELTGIPASGGGAVDAAYEAGEHVFARAIRENSAGRSQFGRVQHKLPPTREWTVDTGILKADVQVAIFGQLLEGGRYATKDRFAKPGARVPINSPNVLGQMGEFVVLASLNGWDQSGAFVRRAVEYGTQFRRLESFLQQTKTDV